jgi:type IV pilus assembly protein PilM
LDLKLGRRSGVDVVGLDIQPGFVAAVKARVNGSILTERAAVRPLAADAVRDGEVADEATLTETLRELFAESGLGKRVRVGVANQRTVLRTIELPPITEEKELAAAVQFQAQEQVPMPLNNAVLDFQPLGIVDTPAGPRQRVVLVAAQRDMVERLLAAVRGAGLTPLGVDLAAFALIRSLYRANAEQDGRVLYLNVDGLTNLAIAEGTTCRFTRVLGGGLEGIASEVAVRRGIPIGEARELVGHIDLTASVAVPEPEPAPQPEPLVDEQAEEDDGTPQSAEEHEAAELAMSYEEMTALDSEPAAGEASSDADVREVLEAGIREIAAEVRNSIDFHRSQDGGGEVSRIVLSGAAQGIPGFGEALRTALGVEVESPAVGVVDERIHETVSTHRLAIAAGLAASEAPQ